MTDTGQSVRPGRRSIPALRVRQWMSEWDNFAYGGPKRSKPRPYFYLLSIPAVDLRALCGIQRREARRGSRRAEDIGIQRRHDAKRSLEIARFLSAGFPWSDLSKAQKDDPSFGDLRKPGWLPTAVVVNVLERGDQRYGQTVRDADLVAVVDSDEGASRFEFPSSYSGSSWEPATGDLLPLEIIDGQHRLWAVDPKEVPDDFELPVVAFHGLDISWQAYLFWTINIKPTRINASLAYDLYPLLRTEDWLERFRGPAVYREVRAQELTEALWLHPKSPWHGRINMLGQRGLGGVTQAAWIRALLSSYIKVSEGRRTSIGGLFGAPEGEEQLALPWSGAQQAAFLIEVWRQLEVAVAHSKNDWAEALRSQTVMPHGDAAFRGPKTLLNADPGIRAVLYVSNDLTVLRKEDLGLNTWIDDIHGGASDEEAVTDALTSLGRHPITDHLHDLGTAMSSFDWRSSEGAGLTDQEVIAKQAIRGSGGYRLLRRQLLAHIRAQADSALASPAARAIRRLGLDKK